MANKDTKTEQVLLSIVFMVVMLLNFGAVAYIDYEYDMNNQNVLLFESDSDMTFTQYDYSDTVEFPERPYDFQTSQLALEYPVVTYGYTQYNRTSVYSGNNTWALSLNDTNHESNYCRIVIALP